MQASRFLPLFAFAAAAAAQQPDFLMTFSQPERTVSTSGGTVLQFLYPDEVVQVESPTAPCSGMPAEKWGPRTAFQTMAGDTNGDAIYWDPTIFGAIDALVRTPATAVGTPNTNPRSLFFSPSVTVGTAISGPPGLRPGDVGHFVRTTLGDGRVEYFMRMEQFNASLGLPIVTPIDIDAIAFDPQFGVFFSLDADIPANTACGPMLVRDGDVLFIPTMNLTYTPDLRIASVTPMSALVLYTEAQMDAFVANANVADRFGACLTTAVDVEALEIDWTGGFGVVPSCTGIALQVPDLLFATETMTGASLLTTAGGGTIFGGPCGAVGTPCGAGPTMGPQVGIRPAAAGVGAPSHINGLCWARTLRYAMEPQQHVLSAFPAGLPAGSTQIDITSPFAWNFVFVEFIPPTVATSVNVFPFSLLCFPDAYVPSLLFYMPTPTVGGFATFPMFAVPPLTTGKVLFQSLAFGGSGLELSAPAIIDVQ